MKSRTMITMNYRKTLRQADQLETLAGQLEKEGTVHLEEALQVVRTNWKGENSAAYLAKGQSLQGKIETSAADLRRTAQTIRRMAKTIYDAEMTAWEIANTRTYH